MAMEKTDFIGKYEKLCGQCRKHLAKLLQTNGGEITLKMNPDGYTGDNTTCHIYTADGDTEKGYVKSIELIEGRIIIKGNLARTGKPFSPMGVERLCEDDIFWLFDAAYDAAPWKGKGVNADD